MASSSSRAASYAEKIRKARYDLDQDALRPSFALDNMIRAAMFMAEKLYGLSFEEITAQVPV
jgi:peptidyl-dipeptidase Dcp